ncbi:DUF4430 domain-containing protein [Peptococcaceae bacterium 1198_IL3148]
MRNFKLLLLSMLVLLLLVGCSSTTTEEIITEKPTANPPVVVTQKQSQPQAASEEKPATAEKAASSEAADKATADSQPQPSEQKPAATVKPSTTPTATLWVTRDFGAQTIAASQVAVGDGGTVMDILKGHTKLETQYGGGFVSAINGLASGYTGPDKIKRDWFYYMNGIMTSVGAADYLPTPGEVIWWDYHDWGNTLFTPAVIGAYPQPFVGGYQGKYAGTLILTTAGCEQQGQQLAQYLRSIGVKNVEQKPYNEQLLLADNKITVVVGLWQQLAADSYWQGLQQQRKKTGLFAELTADYFAALNIQGQQHQRYQNNTGAIVATGSGMGDATPLWLVTGVDDAGLAGAINVLTNNPGTIKQCLGALVVDGKVVPLPVAR